MRRPWLDSANSAGELEALQTDVMRFVAILGLCLAAIFSLVDSAQQAQRATPPQREEPGDAAGQRGAAVASMRQTAAHASRAAASAPDRPPSMLADPVAATAANADREPHRLARTGPGSESAPGFTPTPASAPAERVASDSRLHKDAEPMATSAPGTQRAPVTAVPKPAPAPADEAGFTLEFDSGEALRTLLATGEVTLIATAEKRFWVYRDASGFREVDAPASYHGMTAATVPTALRLHAQGVIGHEVLGWGVLLPDAVLERIEQLMASAAGGHLLIGADADVRLDASR